MILLFLVVNFGFCSEFITGYENIALEQSYVPGPGTRAQWCIHFPSLDTIKSYFRNVSHPLANNILETFEKDCVYMGDPGLPTYRRKPFIILEGNDRTVREVLGVRLARKLKGTYLTNLAPCLFKYIKQLWKGTTLRRAFYLLSIYATIFHAKVQLNLNQAVVLNGGWLEQISFSLLQGLRGAPTPPVTSDLFQYPTDLLQPDLIIYVDYQESMDNNRSHTVQKNRFLELYHMLSERYPIMFQPVNNNFKETVDDIYLNVQKNLSAHRDFPLNYKNY